MVHSDAGWYPQYMLKVPKKMPMTRSPKQMLAMLENDLDMRTSTRNSNWAQDI